LHKLVTTLHSTDPHFIRCILPNSQQQAGIIEDAVVLDQLRCNGVLEGIRISRKGFPNRVLYPEFLKRYYLLGKNVSRNSADPRSATATLLDELKINAEQYRFGVTKVFFKTGQLAYIEELREKKIADMLITVQAASRAMLSRQLYKRMSEKGVAVKIVQRNVRAWVGFKNWDW
jgi:myosin heavy subunit